MVTQPDTGESVGEILAAALYDPRWTEFLAAVAFAKRSGVGHIESALKAFAARASATVAVGIDSRGTSIEGLEALRSALGPRGELLVFHNSARNPHPSFHPKVYLFSSDSEALLIVGSNNLTYGGLFANYEASSVFELDLTVDSDTMFFRQARDILQKWMTQDDLAIRVDDALIARLVESGAIVPESTAGGDPDSEMEVTDGAEIPAVPFGSIPVRGVPGRRGAPTGGTARGTPTMLATPTTGATPATYSWVKRLAPTDAQRPPRPGSNPTGNVRLAQAGNPIDHRTFFRNQMFAGATWAADVDSRGNPIEEAIVQFNVTIDGRAFGLVPLKVDHAPHREAGQNNVPTVLHWGMLREILTATDYSSYFLALRSHPAGYDLEIRRDAP